MPSPSGEKIPRRDFFDKGWRRRTHSEVNAGKGEGKNTSAEMDINPIDRAHTRAAGSRPYRLRFYQGAAFDSHTRAAGSRPYSCCHLRSLQARRKVGTPSCSQLFNRALIDFDDRNTPTLCRGGYQPPAKLVRERGRTPPGRWKVETPSCSQLFNRVLIGFDDRNTPTLCRGGYQPPAKRSVRC